MRKSARIVPEFIEYTFTKSAPYRNHWVGGGPAGNYGADYRLRTVANYAGIWANTIDEVIYFVATRDANEQAAERFQQLRHALSRRQAAGTVIDAFWSVILVGVPDYRVVPNPLNRFHLNNFSPLAKESRRLAENSRRPEAGCGRGGIELAALAGRQAVLADVPDLCAEGHRQARRMDASSCDEGELKARSHRQRNTGCTS